MSEERYWFEDVPEDQRYWFLTQWGMPPNLEDPPQRQQTPPAGLEEEVAQIEAFKERADAVGFGVSALSPPWWTEAGSKWVHDPEGPEYLEAPMLYTTRKRAEEELRQMEAREPEMYLNLVERHGAADVDEAFDNTAPLRAMWLDRDTLLSQLEECDFLCVMVDDRLRLRQDFMEELKNAD